MQSPKGEDGGVVFGIQLVSIYILINILTRLADEQANFRQSMLGAKAHSALISIIYRKILKVTPSSNKQFSQGEIINFIEVDSEKIQELA